MIAVGPKSWQNESTGQLSHAVGGIGALNYENDGGGVWAAIDPVWRLDGSLNWSILAGNHRATVFADGRCAMSWRGPTARHRIVTQTTRLVKVRLSDHQVTVIGSAAPNLQAPTGNVLTLVSVFPGIDKQIIYENDSLTERFVFHQAARDALAGAGPWAGHVLGTATRLDLSQANLNWRDAVGPFAIDATGKDTDGYVEGNAGGARVFAIAGGAFLWQDKKVTTIPVRSWIVLYNGDPYLIELFSPIQAASLPAGDIYHNATFGNSTLQAATLSIENQVAGGVFAPATDGTVDSITVYLDFIGDLASFTIKCGLYKFSDLSFLANGKTPESVFDLPQIDAWNTFTYTGTKPTVTGGTSYIIVSWSTFDTLDSVNIRVGSSSGNTVEGDPATYATNFPDPMVPVPINNFIASIYATYTESAVPVKHRLPLLGVGA